MEPKDATAVSPPAGPARHAVLLATLGVALLAWAFLAWLAVDMASPFAQLTMPGSSQWSLASVAAIALMWALMMAAMMLPSALPAITLFASLSLRSGQRARAAAFIGAYLAIWSAFSVLATAAQWVFQARGWVDPMIVSRSAWLSAVLLVVAGLYQFSSLKQACLTQCRAPMGMLLGHWRPGVGGAFLMGARYGTFCLGCCWALMAVLFVGGVMNLAWIAALSLAVALEKLGPGARLVSRVLGALLLGAGAYKVLVLAT